MKFSKSTMIMLSIAVSLLLLSGCETKEEKNIDFKIKLELIDATENYEDNQLIKQYSEEVTYGEGFLIRDDNQKIVMNLFNNGDDLNDIWVNYLIKLYKNKVEYEEDGYTVKSYELELIDELIYQLSVSDVIGKGKNVVDLFATFTYPKIEVVVDSVIVDGKEFRFDNNTLTYDFFELNHVYTDKRVRRMLGLYGESEIKFYPTNVSYSVEQAKTAIKVTTGYEEINLLRIGDLGHYEFMVESDSNAGNPMGIGFNPYTGHIYDSVSHSLISHASFKRVGETTDDYQEVIKDYVMASDTIVIPKDHFIVSKGSYYGDAYYTIQHSESEEILLDLLVNPITGEAYNKKDNMVIANLWDKMPTSIYSHIEIVTKSNVDYKTVEENPFRCMSDDPDYSYLPKKEGVYILGASYGNYPDSLCRDNVIAYHSDGVTGEYIQVVINGTITDFEIVEVVYDEETYEFNDGKQKFYVDKITDQVVVIYAYEVEGAPFERIKWRDKNGVTHEHDIVFMDGKGEDQ